MYSQIYLTGHPDNNRTSGYQIIWDQEFGECTVDSIYNDRRSNANGGGHVRGDAEVAYCLNGKLYLLNDAMDLYEPYSRFFIHREIFDFSDMSEWHHHSASHGSVFDKNGLLYYSAEREMFTYDLNTKEARRIVDTSATNYYPAADLAFMDGELVGTKYPQKISEDATVIYKYSRGDYGNPIALVDLDTLHNFREGDAPLFFQGILPVSDYCDTTRVYALYGKYFSETMTDADSIYHWYVDENRLEVICEYPGEIDGVTSTTESLFSEPCIVYIDLDSNNSSGAWPQSYHDTVYCYLNSVAIADEDVVVRSPFLVDSIRLCLSITGDTGMERLGINSRLPSTISSYFDSEGCLWLINNGDASLVDFEEALRKIRFLHLGNTFTPGGRQIEIVGFAGGDSSEIVRSKIQAYDPIQGLGPDKKLQVCEGSQVFLRDSVLIDTSISWTPNAAGGVYVAGDSGMDTAAVVLAQETCPDDTLIFEIDVSPTPNELEAPTYFICPSDSINYSLNIDRNSFYAIWNNTDTTYDYTLRSGKNYTVELVSLTNSSCRTLSTISTFEHTPVLQDIDTLLCPSGTLSFRDSIIREAGVYYFEGEPNSPKCSDIIRLTVEGAPEEGKLRVFPDSCLWDELMLEIDMDRISDVMWNTGDQSSTIRVDRPGEYTVEWEYENQCSYSAGIDILECEGSKIYIPNTFTPNADGINDNFTVEGTNFQFLRLVIFDRWGNKIHETRDRFTGWDGKAKGVYANPGVYVYLFEYINARGNSDTESGTITLTR